MQLADLGRLVEQHHGAVMAVAYATTRDLALAEDIAQETFIAAWDARATLREPERVRSWLCGIARNLSRNALRRRREIGDLQGDAVIDDKPSVLGLALADERQRELRTALAEVPEAYREPLVLFYWEDRSIAQVASALGVTEEAAQKRISRARTMLRGELEEPLESTGRSRKTAAAAAAAVLAVCATRSGSAHAAVAKKLMIAKVAGVIAAGGIVAGAVAITREPSAPKAAAPVTSGVDHRSAVPARPQLPDDVAGGSGEPSLGAARGAVPVPADGYEITHVSSRSVAVELAGGTSGIFGVGEAPPAHHKRRITGQVVDETGKAVTGAVVLVGDQINAYMGAFHGAAAAKTGGDGRFSIGAPDDAAGYAIALHPRGWSTVVPVPAGGDAAITLRAPTSGALELRVTRAGAAREADVILTAGDGLRMSLQTDAAGVLRVPLLAPETYRLDVRPAHGHLGGTSPATSREVTLAGGRSTAVAVDLAAGTQLVVSQTKHEVATVEYFLYAGVDVLSRAELKKRSRGGGVTNFLYGGVDADRQAVIHDVAPGTYTLCVEAASRETRFPLACKRIDVGKVSPLEIEIGVK